MIPLPRQAAASKNAVGVYDRLPFQINARPAYRRQSATHFLYYFVAKHTQGFKTPEFWTLGPTLGSSTAGMVAFDKTEVADKINPVSWKEWNGKVLAGCARAMGARNTTVTTVR